MNVKKLVPIFTASFKAKKKIFMEIQKNLSNLSEQVNSYGKLFDDFKSLDELQPPSPNRRKSPRFLNKDNPYDTGFPNTTIANNNPPANNPPANNVEILINKPTPTSNTNTAFPILTTAKDVQTPINLLTETPFISETAIPLSFNNASSIPSTANTSSFTNGQNLSTGAQNSARLINFDASSPKPHTSMAGNINANRTGVTGSSFAPRELRTIPPKKTIFATRFAQDTTTEEMKHHVLANIQNCVPDDIIVYKMNSRNRASFKIIVPEDLFPKIVDRAFWPKNALIREFVYREDDMARLPKSVDTIPKN